MKQVYKIGVSTTYPVNLHPSSNIVLEFFLKTPRQLNPITLSCMAYLGLQNHFSPLDNYNQDFDGQIFKISVIEDEDSLESDDLNEFIGDFKMGTFNVSDGITSHYISNSINEVDVNSEDISQSALVIDIDIFEKVYCFLRNRGFSREFYQDRLSGKNWYIDALLNLYLDKLEQGLIQFDFNWIDEYNNLKIPSCCKEVIIEKASLQVAKDIN